MEVGGDERYFMNWIVGGKAVLAMSATDRCNRFCTSNNQESSAAPV